MKTDFEKTLDSSINLKKKLLNSESEINKIINVITSSLKNGNKILICGNGGSAGDAQHLAAEFLIRLNPKINRRPFPVLNLAQDTSTITACGNDIGFENIFLRDRNAWYLEVAKKELRDLQLTYYKKLIDILGKDDAKSTIKIWEKMVEVLEIGEHRPGHFYAEKSL